MAATALIFGAAYTLWMYKRVYLGPVTNDNVKNLQDIGCREFLILAILAVAVLYMGLYPKPFTDVMDPRWLSCSSMSPNPSFLDQTELRD